jgi:hypothetical protein
MILSARSTVFSMSGNINRHGRTLSGRRRHRGIFWRLRRRGREDLYQPRLRRAKLAENSAHRKTLRHKIGHTQEISCARIGGRKTLKARSN